MQQPVPIKQCPHCRVSLNFAAAGGQRHFLEQDADGFWTLARATCPACNRMILYLEQATPVPESQPVTRWHMIYPRHYAHSCPTGVPSEIAKDFKEAWLVLNDSPNASAALSRRCLQNILEQVAHIPPGQLASQIDQIITSKKLPPNIADELDAIRNVGMFAAHPKKSRVSDEIVTVTPDEARWCLNINQQMLDYYFVALPRSETRIAELNQKLQDVGKPPMKDSRSEKPES
jgi:hypothetical protein